jgi:hypothetical protein
VAYGGTSAHQRVCARPGSQIDPLPLRLALGPVWQFGAPSWASPEGWHGAPLLAHLGVGRRARAIKSTSCGDWIHWRKRRRYWRYGRRRGSLVQDYLQLRQAKLGFRATALIYAMFARRYLSGDLCSCNRGSPQIPPSPPSLIYPPISSLFHPDQSQLFNQPERRARLLADGRTSCYDTGRFVDSLSCRGTSYPWALRSFWCR